MAKKNEKTTAAASSKTKAKTGGPGTMVARTCGDCGKGFKTEWRKGRYPSRCKACHKAAYGTGKNLKK